MPAVPVEARARARGATPFNIEGCELGRHGEDVSFDSILKTYQLNDPAVLLLAEIVRATDSHLTNPHPAGEALRWVAFGSNAPGLSDHEILAREFNVYEALYAECQRRATKHGLPGSSKMFARLVSIERRGGFRFSRYDRVHGTFYVS